MIDLDQEVRRYIAIEHEGLGLVVITSLLGEHMCM